MSATMPERSSVSVGAKSRRPAKILLNLPSQYAGQPSGVSRFAFSLIEELLSVSDFDFVLRSPFPREELPAPLKNGRLQVVRTPRPSMMALDVILQAFKVYHFCRKHKVDLILNLDPYGAPVVSPPAIMVVHDLYFRTLPDEIGPRAVATNDLIFRIMLAANRTIITVSNATRQTLEKFYPTARGRTRTCYSASPLAKMDSIEVAREVSSPYLLAVGNATKNKNLVILAEAMSSLSEQHPGLKLVHVGFDPAESIGKRLKELGAADLLLRLTGIDDARMVGLYQHAEAFCMPSLDEGFGLPILEAQRLGCPVICSNRSAMPEVAGNGAIYFDPTNAHQLANAISKLLSDGGKRGEMIQAGFENARRFSWSATAQAYLNEIKLLLDAPK